MPKEPFTCPECRQPIGPGTTTDIYKHAVSCFHLPNTGVERLLQDHAGKNDERSRRVLQILRAAQQEAG